MLRFVMMSLPTGIWRDEKQTLEQELPAPKRTPPRKPSDAPGDQAPGEVRITSHSRQIVIVGAMQCKVKSKDEKKEKGG
jgi:hypothetical protein